MDVDYSNSQVSNMYSCTYIINNMVSHIDNAIYIGIRTRQLLQADNGEATHTEERRFYQAVCAFYCTAADYALKHLPLNDRVLQNARFVNFKSREAALFSEVEFFVNRYNN